MLINSIEIGK